MDKRQSNKDLIELIKQGIDTKENLERLYFQNKGFIYLVIRKRVHGIFEESDLMQQAFIALVKAVKYHDCTLQETNFLQILKYCIWNEIRNLTCDVPAHMQAKIIKYKLTYSKLYNELGYKPKAYQIMSEMGISQKELETIRAAMRKPLSLDEPIGDEGDTTRLDLYASSQADEEIGFEGNLEQQYLKKTLAEALSKLPDNGQEVINKKYYKNWSLEQCGQEMNVSRERVRQIESKAFRLLRKDRQLKKKLKGYLDINEYKSVGSRQFNTTHISAVEWLVIEREKIGTKEQEINSWLNK